MSFGEPLDLEINLIQNISDEAPKATQASEEMTKSVGALSDLLEKLNKTLVDAGLQLGDTLAKASNTDDAVKAWETYVGKLKDGQQELAVISKTLWQESMVDEFKLSAAVLDEYNAEIYASEKSITQLTTACEKQSGVQEVLGDRVERLTTQRLKLMDAMAKEEQLNGRISPKYQELRGELEKLSSSYGKIQAEARAYSATSNIMLDGISQGVTGALGAFTASQGIMGLFVTDNEQLIKLQSTLQSSMSITMGLAQLQNTLHSTSIFRLGVVSKVTSAFAAANTRLAISLGISSLAAKALMASLTLGLSVAITGIIYLFSRFNEATKEANRLIEESKKLSGEVIAEYAKQASAVQVLVNEINNENISNELRKKRIDDLKKIIPSYNGMLDQEGKLINNNTDAIEKYLIALKEEIRLKSQRGNLEKLYTQQIEIEEELAEKSQYISDNTNKPKFKPIVTPTPYGVIVTHSDESLEMANSVIRKRELLKEQEKINAEVDKVKNRYNKQLANNLAVQAEITLDSLNNREEEIKRLKDLFNKQEIGSKEYLALETEIAQKEKSLNNLRAKGTIPTRKTVEDKTDIPTRKTVEDKTDDILAKKSYDYQKLISDARVKSIENGAEKERQTIKKEYEETQAYIARELDSLAILEKKTGKPASDNRDKLFELDIESTRQYDAELQRINANSKATLNGIFAEVNARFTSELEQNILDIKSYYAKLIQEASMADARLEEIEQLEQAQDKDIARAGLTDKLQRSELDETLELEKANNLASIGLTEAAEQAKHEIVKAYLQKRIELLRSMGDDTMNKEADLLEQRLNNMQSSPKSITGLVNAALFDSIKKGFEKTGASAEEAEGKTKSLFSNFQKGGAQAVSIIGDLKTMFGGISEDFDIALDSLGSIAEGFASGGITGGVMATIGQGVKMFSHLAAVEKEHQQALKALALAKLELQREYYNLLLKEQLYYKQGSNIFGTDQIRGAANAINVYRKSIKKLAEEMRGEMPEMPNLNNNIGVNFDKYFLEKYARKLKAYNEGVGALADVDIVTGSRKSGWGPWKKRKDVYQPLLDVYDDILDKEGNLNTSRIETILNNHKMSDENRALLESLLDLSVAAEEADEKLRGYLSQTFGGLGDSLANSIVAAFRSGEDAALAFKDSVSDVLTDLSTQMVFSLFLKEIFDKLEDDIHQAYEDLADEKISEQQLSKQITNILGGFFGGIGGDIEEANKFLEEFWKNAELVGFDRPEGERQGAKGAFENASQDSIHELNGMMYATRQMVGDMRQNGREMLLVERAMTNQLDILVERSEDWRHLQELPKVLKRLDSIETYGLKMKI